MLVKRWKKWVCFRSRYQYVVITLSSLSSLALLLSTAWRRHLEFIHLNVCILEFRRYYELFIKVNISACSFTTSYTFTYLPLYHILTILYRCNNGQLRLRLLLVFNHIFIIIFWFLKISLIKSIRVISGNHFPLNWLRSLISCLFFQYYFVLLRLYLRSLFTDANCIPLWIDAFIWCYNLFYASVSACFILVHYLLLRSWLDTSWFWSKSSYCSKSGHMLFTVVRYSTEFTFLEISFPNYKV